MQLLHNNGVIIFSEARSWEKKMSKAPHRKTDHGTFRGFRRKEFLVQEMSQTKWHSSMFKPVGSCNLLCATGLVVVFLRLSWGFLPTPTFQFMDDAIKKPLVPLKGCRNNTTTIIYPYFFFGLLWFTLVQFSSYKMNPQIHFSSVFFCLA